MAELRIDAAIPGGNSVIERIEGDTVFLRQDQRDTEDSWFYWCFRVRGAAGRTLTFSFTDWDVIGVRGPALSEDAGWTWRYLGPDCAQDATFPYTFAPDADERWFCFTLPYTRRNLDRWLGGHADDPGLAVERLCVSNGGRPVDRLLAGCRDADAPVKVFLAARHHCCESIPGYLLEGFLDAVLADDEHGDWWRRSVALAVVPMADADGVEQGDQGKLRLPRDHGRDYAGQSLYAETAAIRDWLPVWGGERLRLVLDLHCPWIRGGFNEHAYFVGSEDAGQWREMNRLGADFEASIRGPLPYHVAGNLPFGQSWNTQPDSDKGRGLCRWARRTFPSALAATLETPYAALEGVEVTADRARAFGADLSLGVRRYLDRTAGAL